MNEAIQKALTRPSSIQVVEWSDDYRDQAVAIAREMLAASPVYSGLPLDEAKLVRQLSAAGKGVSERYFRMAIRGGAVLGGFYGVISSTFFSNELIARDMGWWVKSTARGGMAAVLLLADFERWAHTNGAKKVMVGQSMAINIERTTKLYRHCGFTVIGFNTVKDI